MVEPKKNKKKFLSVCLLKTNRFHPI